MRVRAVFIILTAMMFFGVYLCAQESKEHLWQKAVGLAAAAEDAKIVPGTLYMSTIVKKKDGTVESDSTVKFRTVDKGDELDMELLSAVENGKDVTEEARKKNEEEKKDSKERKDGEPLSVSIGDNPFDPGVQKSVKAVYKMDVVVDGRAASIFTFTEKSPDGKSMLKGRAWLDSTTGMPIKVESTTDPLPDHVEKMTTTTRYKTTQDGLWVPESCLIAGEAGFLWMHFSSETKVQFADFRISTVKEKGK